MARLNRVAVAAITAVLVVIALLFFGTLALKHWSGTSHDLSGVLLRCFIALPVVIGIMAFLWPTKKRSAVFLILAGLIVGLAYGYLAVRVFHRINSGMWQIPSGSIMSERLLSFSFFNPFALDIDLEAIVIGAVAGMSSLLMTVSQINKLLRFSVTTILVAVGVLAPVPILNAITQNEELTVAMVMPRETLAIRPVAWSADYVRSIDVSREESAVLERLKRAGLSRDYEVVWLIRKGHGKKVVAIVVVPEELRDIDLPQSNGVDVIYVPESARWQTNPGQFPELDRKITILRHTSSDGPCRGYLYVDDIFGTSYGFGIPKPNDTGCLHSRNE